ncbi:hypothetical protein LTR53_014947 [Teratosphaeriaceae sp. CCFEE 6253]|nr:hypothetical protein LTR53_014947 [Teratosphaeriaceae sp. CCFEE 6253]
MSRERDTTPAPQHPGEMPVQYDQIRDSLEAQKEGITAAIASISAIAINAVNRWEDADEQAEQAVRDNEKKCDEASARYSRAVERMQEKDRRIGELEGKLAVAEVQVEVMEAKEDQPPESIVSLENPTSAYGPIRRDY